MSGVIALSVAVLSVAALLRGAVSGHAEWYWLAGAGWILALGFLVRHVVTA